MYWFSGAPKLEEPDNDEEVTRFIDRFITTSGDVLEIHEVIQCKHHKHSASWLREMRGQQFCRFSMPYPPMPATLVFYPFEENESNVEEYKEIFKKVKELLKSVSEEESAMFNNFEYFLSHLEISYEEYKFVIRSSLKKPQVFLRRQFSDRLLNAHSINILGLHIANMDIQFILDAYAC